MADTKEKFTELLIQETLGEIEKTVQKKLEDTHTSFNAKFEGLKVVLNSKIDEITAIVEQKPYKINFGTIEAPKTEIVHKQFKTIVNIIKSQKRNPKNIMMVGEAGSGKTHLASSIAKACGLKFYPMSVGLQTTKSDLLGFINAHGQYVTSPLREAFEKGGVLLLDEFDAAHAGVVTIINSLLANGHCSFPDGIIEKNDKFICMVACNTYGHGANIDYVGRNRLDGATLDRFITVHVGYDEILEEQLTCNPQWMAIIKQMRQNIEKQGLKMIISPRASMNGADLLDAGFKIEDVVDMVIMKGADNDTKLKVMEGIDLSRYCSMSFTESKSGIDYLRESSKEISKTTYSRDLSKYQTFKIKTETSDIDSMYEIEPLNDIIHGSMAQWIDKDYYIHAGRDWAHQYTQKDELYFATDKNHKFTEFEKSWLLPFFLKFDGQKVSLGGEKPIAFEFVQKGCRNPYKVIILGE